MLAWTMGLFMALVFISGITGMTSQPAPASNHHTDNVSAISTDADGERQEYHSLAYADYSDEFTRIYNGYEVKWSKNGRLMMRNGDSGPYKFVKRSV